MMGSKKSHKRIELSTGTRRRISPFALIGVGITLLVVLGAGAALIIPRLGTHADAVNMNCTILVPANPLSARGLATPYQLSATNAADGPCNETNTDQSAFVQGVIYNPATGAFSVYSPLVIDAGTTPAVAPKVPALPRNAVVGLWFGFNAANLTLRGAQRNTLRQGSCVNGQGGSVFGQFAYCNAVAFFSAANRGIARGLVKVPALQTANDGQPCMTTRDFALIDQDQSDNVQTQYLGNGTGQTAQFSAANQTALQDATTIANPSDNALLTTFIDPVLGCTPWTAPDLANAGAMVSALPLDELMAAADQKAPVALVPVNDPMTLNGNGQASLSKTNLYRAGVDQPQARSQNQASGASYCSNMIKMAIPRLQLDQTEETNAASPVADAADSLFTFLAMRVQQSYENLGCQALLNQPNPVTTQTDANGVVISATFATGTSAVTPTAGTTAPAVTPTPVDPAVTPTAGTTAPAVTPTPVDPAVTPTAGDAQPTPTVDNGQ